MRKMVRLYLLTMVVISSQLYTAESLELESEQELKEVSALGMIESMDDLKQYLRYHAPNYDILFDKVSPAVAVEHFESNFSFQESEKIKFQVFTYIKKENPKSWRTLIKEIVCKLQTQHTGSRCEEVSRDDLFDAFFAVTGMVVIQNKEVFFQNEALKKEIEDLKKEKEGAPLLGGSTGCLSWLAALRERLSSDCCS